MYGNDRASATRDRRLDQRRIEIEAVRFDVHEHRRRPDQRNRLGRGEERERCCDHLVAGSDTQGPQAYDQRIGTGIQSDGVPNAEVVGHVPLERLDIGSQHKAPRA